MMKTPLFLKIAWLAGWLSGSLWAGQTALDEAPVRLEKPPFRHVLVLSGGGLDAPIYLGVLDAAQRSGWLRSGRGRGDTDPRPDLIISTCGASIASGLANQIPDVEERKRFMLSPASRDLLDQVQLHGTSLVALLWRVYENPLGARIPQVFQQYLLDVPQTIGLEEGNRLLRSTGLRVMMGSGELEYGPEQVGMRRHGRRVVREVYLTDPDTARLVSPIQFCTPIAQYPGSAVYANTALITGLRTWTATRASVADPIMVAPAEINGKYYTTGGVDLYPIELAMKLGDEVALTSPSKWTRVETNVVRSVYGFDPRERNYDLMRKAREHRLPIRFVDTSDFELFAAEHGFDPKCTFFHFVRRVPPDMETYRAKAALQFHWGASRFEEALRQPVGSQAHLRREVEHPPALRIGSGKASGEWWAPARQLGLIRERPDTEAPSKAGEIRNYIAWTQSQTPERNSLRSKAARCPSPRRLPCTRMFGVCFPAAHPWGRGR